MVHFPGLAHTRLCIQRAVSECCSEGFPHSEIPGSMPACGSPGLIAACHVLLRLLAPRHPPYALSSLIIKLTQRVAPVNLKILVRGLERLPILHLDKHRLHSSSYTSLYPQQLRSARAIFAVTQYKPRFEPYFKDYSPKQNTKKASALRNAYLFSCQRSVPQVHLSFPLPVGRSRQNYGRKIKNPASSAGRNSVSSEFCAMLD